MNKKTEKIVNLVVNIIVGVIVVIIFLLCINIIAQKDKGYTNIFGKAYLVVQTESMVGDKEDNFDQYDLIVVNILSDEEKLNLEVGQVITFYDYNISNNANSLNSHRITAVSNAGTSAVTYTTKGDNNLSEDIYSVSASAIVGTFNHNLGKIGVVLNWFNSSAGFFVCVVLPSFLIVAYCAFNLYKVIRDGRKQTAVENGEITADMTKEEIAAAKARERELLKAEIMAEMQAAEQQAAEAAQLSNTGGSGGGGNGDAGAGDDGGVTGGGAGNGNAADGNSKPDDDPATPDYSEGES